MAAAGAQISVYPHARLFLCSQITTICNMLRNKKVPIIKHAIVRPALPAATQELAKIGASQINGCAACTDMHTKDAGHAGESPVRLNLVAVWREATVFTEAERAALELTEQGTRIADAAGGVTDEAWANAAKHYDDDQLAALVSLIAEINT